jgi:signal transduction histidine kinase
MEYWCREWQQQQTHQPTHTLTPAPTTVAPHPTAALARKADDLPPGQHRWVWLGQLAGGLLHDMAVPLSALSSSVQSLQPLVAHQAAPAGALAAQALQATQRLEALLQAVRQLTHGPQHQGVQGGAGLPPVLADGVALLEQAQLLLKHKAPEGLVVVYEGPRSAQLQTQPQWVLQVLMNGLLNAYQALEGQATPQVRCRLQHVPLAQRMAWQWCVEDNGPGMPPEVLARAMEAGFSTRLGRGGSGLGLSFCRQVVEEVLGGTLALHSQVGQGTQFILTLPSTL